MIRIEPVDPESKPARALIAAADAYMASLYPAESNHLDDPAILKGANALFLGCFCQTEMVGCGAVKILDDDGRYGEVKRVFVTGTHRGKGYSKAIMEELERHLRAQGVSVARLETGIHQPEALGLYRRLGYTERGPFGHYKPDPLSLFLEKRLEVGLRK